jgi:hypothetical protein
MLKTASPLALLQDTPASGGADSNTLTPLAYRIPEAAKVSGLSRTRLYEEFGAGRLTFLKAGARTLVDARSLQALVASLPRAMPRGAR